MLVRRRVAPAEVPRIVRTNEAIEERVNMEGTGVLDRERDASLGVGSLMPRQESGVGF
jgi:hypothetical protein